MSAPDKPPPARTPTPALPPAPAPARNALGAAARETAVDLVTHAIFDKRPYLKYAFGNPFNLSLFLGTLAAAGLTLNPVLALAALGAEAIWLLYAPDSKRLRHLLWDPRFEKVRDALLEQEREARMVGLDDHARARVQALVTRQREIRQLAARNPSFTADLLRGELVKTDKLVDAFLDMALTCDRYEQYLATVDAAGVERERGRWERAATASDATEPELDIARKNLAILGKRLDKMKEIGHYLDVSRGQLDLIENSFQLIGDQIVTMQSPQELSGQLNDLLAGVESIEQSAADTERLLTSLGDHGMIDARILPAWADDLRRRYLRGESALFVLHGNVFDVVVHGQTLLGLTQFLVDVLLRDNKDAIAVYNLSTGVRFAKMPKTPAVGTDDVLLAAEKSRVLTAMERLLVSSSRTAVVIEYADTVAPAGDPAFQSDDDRAAVVTLHRWSFLPEIEKGDNVVLLVTENLAELSPRLVSNPKIAVLDIPMPDLDTRRAVARIADGTLPESDTNRYAELTAGLKAVQIANILAPPPAAEEDRSAREAFILGILGESAEAKARAEKLAVLTAGMSREEVLQLIAPGAIAPDPAGAPADRTRREAERLIARRKREILERECFGLVEFVEPAHGFEAVGGMEEVKKDLLVLAENIREGHTSRVPMGILFTGPMGTGKTFVAEAFAKECGLTTVKLKNFRSKWVGATEGNLEKILTVIKAIGQVVVIIDEGDRAFGNTDGEGDGGTSSRVIARIKEFMSDTSNRGRILFLVMTNRPDKLDVDLKRAGRLDRKIPFLYVQTPEEVEQIIAAQLRKNRIRTTVDVPSIRDRFSALLVGYSNADIEAVVLLANDDAAREGGTTAGVEAAHFERAAADYFPSRDEELLEYMELLAVFEASSRRLLPAKYANTSPDELDARLRQLRAVVGNRR